jgi:hypothetical protein
VQDLSTFRTGNVISGEITPTAAFLTAFEAGNIYVNVHTAANPGGEIRGQVTRDDGYMNMDVRLTSSNVVPPVPTAASGVAIVRGTYTLDTLYVFATFANLSSAVTDVRLNAAPLGVANSAATNISNNLAPLIQNDFLGVQLIPPTGSANALINSILSGDVNLQISTATNPNGELRGQIYRYAREGYTFAFSGNQERPTPTPSQAYGAGLVSIDRDQTNAHFMMAWGGLSGPVTGAHFHTGLATQSGPVIFNLPPYFDNTTNPTAAYGYWKNDNTTAPFTLRRALQFRADSMYANLHTAQYPAGEIRGQVLRGARNLARVLATQPAAIIAESFSTYPNPAREQLTIIFDARVAEAGTLEVVDLLGRVVQSKPLTVTRGANKYDLSLEKFSNGLYFVQISIAGTKIVAKFVKE